MAFSTQNKNQQKIRNHQKLLYINLKIPFVTREGKNVDIIVLKGNQNETIKGKDSILTKHERYIAPGELKGEIDPAGADEHWKTADTALKRIRESFQTKELNPYTFFIGAAVENAMTREIFEQIQNKTLRCAANLTNEKQLTEICQWIIDL